MRSGCASTSTAFDARELLEGARVVGPALVDVAHGPLVHAAPRCRCRRTATCRASAPSRSGRRRGTGRAAPTTTSIWSAVVVDLESDLDRQSLVLGELGERHVLLERVARVKVEVLGHHRTRRLVAVAQPEGPDRRTARRRSGGVLGQRQLRARRGARPRRSTAAIWSSLNQTEDSEWGQRCRW